MIEYPTYVVSTAEYLRSVARAVSTLEIVPADDLVLLGARRGDSADSEEGASPTKRIKISEITLGEESKY